MIPSYMRTEKNVGMLLFFIKHIRLYFLPNLPYNSIRNAIFNCKISQLLHMNISTKGDVIINVQEVFAQNLVELTHPNKGVHIHYYGGRRGCQAFLIKGCDYKCVRSVCLELRTHTSQQGRTQIFLWGEEGVSSFPTEGM